ncbi:hypothetical protein [Kitasatospora camelliae]|uniref:PAP2 superfamily protein n=1 Tax=Kitasatospora camelliae TaxID=3156397 RepID=A0AAU8K247_9ACTN
MNPALPTEDADRTAAADTAADASAAADRTGPATAAAPADRESRLARRLTDGADPKNVIILLCLALGCGLYGWRGLGWALIALTFAAVLPILYIVKIAEGGSWAGRHVTDRQRRLSVLPVISGSVAVGVLLQFATDAPGPMVALTAAMWCTITAVLPITRFWQISVHTAVLSGGLVMLAVTYGPWWLTGFAGVAVLGWSRVALREHTPWQTAAGAALGALVGGGVFALLR